MGYTAARLALEDYAEHGTDLTEVARELLEDGFIPQGWSRSRRVDFSDVAALLNAIVELRKLGYTVEPGGNWMATLNDQYVRGRMAQYLFERGYPVNDIAEDGISPDGYLLFLKDKNGKRNVNLAEGILESELRPWQSPRHWEALERIMKGDW